VCPVASLEMAAQMEHPLCVVVQPELAASYHRSHVLMELRLMSNSEPSATTLLP